MCMKKYIRKKLYNRKPITVNINQIFIKDRLFGKSKLIDIKNHDYNNWNDEQLKLEKSLEENGYNENCEEPIIITKDFICLNGHHRLSLMAKNKNQLINIYQINLSWWRIFPLVILGIIFKVEKKYSKNLTENF